VKNELSGWFFYEVMVNKKITETNGKQIIIRKITIKSDYLKENDR